MPGWQGEVGKGAQSVVVSYPPILYPACADASALTRDLWFPQVQADEGLARATEAGLTGRQPPADGSLELVVT